MSAVDTLTLVLEFKLEFKSEFKLTVLLCLVNSMWSSIVIVSSRTCKSDMGISIDEWQTST